MSTAAILAMIDARAASNAEFAALVAARNDAGIAAALSEGRTRPRTRMITERGVISILGPIEGEALLQGLEQFAAATLPAEHPLAARHAGIRRIIGWLRPPSEGVDIGDPLTAQLLQTLAAIGTPGITSGRVAVLLAAAREDDPISVSDVSAALNGRAA
jgi:hypothetical protein